MSSLSNIDFEYVKNYLGTEARLSNESASMPVIGADAPISPQFLARGQAFDWVQSSNTFKWRIVEVFVDETTHRATILAIQLDTKRTLLKAIPLETFAQEMADARLAFIEDPWALLWKDRLPTENAIKRRDRRYAIIFPLIRKRYWNEPPSILQAEISELVKSSGYSDRAIEHALRDYLQNGQSRNALTPLWFLSGLSGKRIPQAGAPKRGRPGKLKKIKGTDLFETGCNITPRIEIEFQLVYENFVRKGICKSDKLAHHLVILFFYSNLPDFIDDLQIAPVVERPSGDSYTKWRQNNISRVEHLQNKLGETEFQRNHRAKLGTSADMVSAPYKLWQTDVKTIRCFITTPLAPGLVIKSISLGLYVDNFDGFIPGHYAGPERESQIVYLYALQNATRNGYVPDGIYGDRGPVEGENISALIRDITIDEIHNAPPYRPDMKGLVESILRVVVDLALQWYPNASVHLDKGDAQYTLPVSLNLSQLRRLIEIAIRMHNYAIWMKRYPVKVEALPDMIEKTPAALQQYGFSLYGEPRMYPVDLIMKSVLKVGRGSISAKGLRNLDAKAEYYYTCPALERKIANAAYKKQFESCEIRYDPRDSNILSVVLGRKLFECHMIESEETRKFVHRDLSEIALYDLFDRILESQSSEKRLLLQLKGELESMSVMLETPEAEALMKAKGITLKQFINVFNAIQELSSGKSSSPSDTPGQLNAGKVTRQGDDPKQSNTDDYSALFGLEPNEILIHQ